MTTPNQTNQTSEPDLLSMTDEQFEAYVKAKAEEAFKVRHPVLSGVFRFFNGPYRYIHLVLTGLCVMWTTFDLFAWQGWSHFLWDAIPCALLIYQRANYDWVKVSLPGGYRV